MVFSFSISDVTLLENLFRRNMQVGDPEIYFDYGMKYEGMTVKKIFEYQEHPAHKVFLRKKKTKSWQEWLELLEYDLEGHKVMVVRHAPTGQYIHQRPNVNTEKDDLHLVQPQEPDLCQLKGLNHHVVVFG